jgi:hypothetical protein
MSLVDSVAPAPAAGTGTTGAGTAGTNTAVAAATGDLAGKGEGYTPPADGVTPTSTASTDWYYDENVKGNGNKPEWLKDKYKTTADQAKAYAELEKKLGAFTGAPENYDLSLGDEIGIKFEADDPLLKELIDTAKEKGVSQEFMTDLLKMHAKALTANIPDPEVEIKKLGPNGPAEVRALSEWASAKFTQEEYGIFKRMMSSAEAVRFFEKVRNIATSGDVAAPSSHNHMPHETVEQVKELVGDPRYKDSQAFRDEVRKRMTAAMAHQRPTR